MLGCCLATCIWQLCLLHRRKCSPSILNVTCPYILRKQLGIHCLHTCNHPLKNVGIQYNTYLHLKMVNIIAIYTFVSVSSMTSTERTRKWYFQQTCSSQKVHSQFAIVEGCTSCIRGERHFG